MHIVNIRFWKNSGKYIDINLEYQYNQIFAYGYNSESGVEDSRFGSIHVIYKYLADIFDAIFIHDFTTAVITYPVLNPIKFNIKQDRVEYTLAYVKQLNNISMMIPMEGKDIIIGRRLSRD